jgi:uncharacterized protein involved in tolerance to divalent cations
MKTRYPVMQLVKAHYDGNEKLFASMAAQLANVYADEGDLQAKDEILAIIKKAAEKIQNTMEASEEDVKMENTSNVTAISGVEVDTGKEESILHEESAASDYDDEVFDDGSRQMSITDWQN